MGSGRVHCCAAPSGTLRGTLRLTTQALLRSVHQHSTVNNTCLCLANGSVQSRRYRSTAKCDVLAMLAAGASTCGQLQQLQECTFQLLDEQVQFRQGHFMDLLSSNAPCFCARFVSCRTRSMRTCDRNGAERPTHAAGAAQHRHAQHAACCLIHHRCTRKASPVTAIIAHLREGGEYALASALDGWLHASATWPLVRAFAHACACAQA